MRSAGWPLAVACLVAAGVGAVWYMRNLLLHGSPLYPFVHTPGGDPPGQLWRLIQPSFLDRPAETLSGRGHLYIDVLGGGVVLIAAAVLLPAIVRTRAVLVSSVAAIGAMLLWAKLTSTASTA